jgi:hypothetical protein
VMVKRLLPGLVRGANFTVRKDGKLNMLCYIGRRCAAMWVFPQVTITRIVVLKN